MRKKITLSLWGLYFNVLSLVLVFSAIILKKQSKPIEYFTIASMILYFIALYHFKFEKRKGRKQA